MNNIFSVKDKVIFITGSTRGIGRKLAIDLAGYGAKVIVHGRSKEAAKILAQDIGGAYVYGDLEKEHSVIRMIESILKNQDHLDVLINNAGFEDHSFIEKMDMQLYDKIINICIRSHYLLTRSLLPLLKKSPAGSIINMSSIHQTVPVRANSPYCMAKAAMDMFTKILSLELASYNIRANSLAPGAIETEMNAEIIQKIGKDKFEEWIPIGRVGSTKEIVGPVIFLSSEASSYMTGATLYVDGGYMQNLLRYEP